MNHQLTVSALASVEIQKMNKDEDVPAAAKPCAGVRWAVWCTTAVLNKDQSKTACSRHTIKHDRLEAAVLCAIQQQVSLAVNDTEIIERINRAPLVKSQSQKEDYEQQAQEEVLQTLRAEQAELENGVDAENPFLAGFHQYQNIDKLTGAFSLSWWIISRCMRAVISALCPALMTSCAGLRLRELFAATGG